MQTVVIIPEPEWRQVLSRLEKLEQAEQDRQTPAAPPGQGYAASWRSTR